jgi:hypothetical protein
MVRLPAKAMIAVVASRRTVQCLEEGILFVDIVKSLYSWRIQRRYTALWRGSTLPQCVSRGMKGA